MQSRVWDKPDVLAQGKLNEIQRLVDRSRDICSVHFRLRGETAMMVRNARSGYSLVDCIDSQQVVKQRQAACSIIQRGEKWCSKDHYNQCIFRSFAWSWNYRIVATEWRKNHYHAGSVHRGGSSRITKVKRARHPARSWLRWALGNPPNTKKSNGVTEFGRFEVSSWSSVFSSSALCCNVIMSYMRL